MLLLIAFRNLVQHRKRTLLLGGAIAGVTTLLTLLLSLSSGIHSTMLESATTLSTGHINVAGFYKVTAGQSAPVITGYRKLMEIASKALPELDHISPRGRGWAKLVSDTSSLQVAIGGIDLQHEPRFRKIVQLAEGSMDELSKPGTILIFQEQAKKLGVKVGDSMVISSQTTRGVSNTIDVRVVAIAQDMGIMSSWNVFVSSESVRALGQLNDDTTGALHILVKDVKRIPDYMDRLRKAYADAGYILMEREAKAFWMKFESVNREDWTGQKLDLTTWDEEMSFFKWTTTAIDGIMYILTIVLLIIIGIGIMNSMWIAIRERTREIGTLRAIGMQRRRVLGLFLLEALMLGALGTASGVVIGALLSVIINAFHLPVPEMARMFLMANTVHLMFDPLRILGGMVVITACTTLISVIPSIHAARRKPVTAMQSI